MASEPKRSDPSTGLPTASAGECEAELFYIHVPCGYQPVRRPVEFLTVQEAVADESLCSALWHFISTAFRTRSKFLAIWPNVRYLAVDRQGTEIYGLLLVSASLNWQIDYVTVRDDMRRRGIAAALIRETLNQAWLRHVPYVMLTSKESLRPLYEGMCGFSVVGKSDTRSAADSRTLPRQEALVAKT